MKKRIRCILLGICVSLMLTGCEWIRWRSEDEALTAEAVAETGQLSAANESAEQTGPESAGSLEAFTENDPEESLTVETAGSFAEENAVEPSTEAMFWDEDVEVETQDVDVIKQIRVDDGWNDDGSISLRRKNFDYTENETEKKIFSYVQGREEYYEDTTWCGPWAYRTEGGQGFYAFGCGLCCLTNTVDTLTDKKLTPGDMLDNAKKITDYHPSSGVGALSWEQLQDVAEHYKLKAKLRDKPSEYEEFKYQISAAKTAIVLICSHNDDTLWAHTGGHYVSVWEYDPATDTVFVTDSSGLYNRVRVALYDIYLALKTGSDHQYMTITKQ